MCLLFSGMRRPGHALSPKLIRNNAPLPAWPVRGDPPLGSETSAGPVPEHFIGLWRRRLFETESQCDTTSEVWWLQTGELYADLHLPIAAASERPSRRQGYAGALEVHGDVLTWHSWLDSRSATDIVDLGRVHFEGQSLIGQGARVSHREIWERVAAPSDDRLALVLRDERASTGEWRTRRGVFVVLGEYFMYALDRSLCLSRGGRMQSGRQSAFAVFQFDHEISFGVRHGRVPWEIQHSTLPHREGQSLLAVHGLPEPVTGCEWRQRVQIPAALRCWQAVEIGAGFKGLA